MRLKEQVYSVLIVSASEKFRDSLLSLLPEADYSPIVTVTSVGGAERARNLPPARRRGDPLFHRLLPVGRDGGPALRRGGAV